MLYRILADSVVLLHLLFIIFVVTGGFLVVYRGWLVLLHLPAVAWGAYIEFSGGICPLTPLENQFIFFAGEEGYAGGFINHYLLPVIYPAGLTRDLQFVLGLFVLAVNMAAYLLLLYRYRRRRVG